MKSPFDRLVILSCLTLFLPNLANPQTAAFEELAGQAQANVDSNPALAAELFQKALKLRPSWGDGWLYLGGSLYRLGQYSQALEAFDKGIAMTPPRGTSWAFRGLCEFELKHFEKALENFQRGEAIGLGANHPFEAVVREHAALIYVRASLFDDAMRQLEPLSRYGENSSAVIRIAGLCALTLNLWPDELSDHKRPVVELAGRALWSATSRRAEDAVAAFQQLLDTYPNEPGVHYAHGIYLLESNQGAALQEFEQELRANPSHWPSLLASAGLENERGDPERALRTARAALKSAPAGYLWLCHAEQGRAFLSMHQTEKAIPEFQAATQNAPSNPQMHYYLEQAYRLAGRNEAARRERAEFVRLKSQQDPATLASSAAN
jgi:tetratricopeptide (TPR) repeat protein